ncbi:MULTISPECIES: septum formation family protein [unclassified Pseudofrankia]|uniref:septum formation family protein n=1 Tax=unclassified Pseudofrankia TaxID=2994372 RepID=UPI0008DAFD75|nr:MULTISPECIES: septum formation family protein [unclassified Pseudofrankia]MDT3443641.1 septum formation family protein [Pseudofrankia sp. BMG5.37]OHV60710.1 hypothetical protein BCD48_40765 [Pseudofrankia sp. BMG5.36]
MGPPSPGTGGWYLNPASGQPTWRPAAPAPVPTRRRSTKLVAAVVVGSVVGLAVLAFAATTIVGLVAGDDAEKEPVAAPAPVATAAVTPSPTPLRNARLTQYDYERGKCYFWPFVNDPTPDVDEVPCSEPHLFESVADEPIDLSADFSTIAPYPSVSDWWAISARLCQQTVEAYLGHSIDPHGRIKIEPIIPVLEGWVLGEREMTCGVRVSSSHPRDPVSYVSTGSAKDLDQSRVWEPGVCLNAEGIPLLCEYEHVYVAVGDVVLPGVPGSAPPSDEQQGELIETSCAERAREFFGPSFQELELENLGVMWYPITRDGWEFGNRTISCLIGYVNADGTPRVTTGDPRRGRPA